VPGRFQGRLNGAQDDDFTAAADGFASESGINSEHRDGRDTRSLFDGRPQGRASEQNGIGVSA
jgi:hypothetical protein